jgi:hypothetical protein
LPPLREQRPRHRQAGEDDPREGDEDAARDLERAPVRYQHAPEPGRASPEGDEHRREPRDEAGRRHGHPARPRPELVEADPGHEREVAGDER